MKQLHLFRRIVFVDWHGVACSDPFWASILHSSAHPLRHQLETKLGEVFSRKSMIHDWMRGTISSQDVIAEMGLWTDRRFRHDFLARRLDMDCARMEVNAELFQVLHRLRPIVLVVLATDNMDCFARAFVRARTRRRPPKRESKGLALVHWAQMCDDILCSSEVGALKAEDPVGFFGPLLCEYGLQFSDALLIDDRAENCEAFQQHGGTTIQWKMGTSDIAEVTVLVHRWLGMSSGIAR